jgi:FkbM family methyltransferase
MALSNPVKYFDSRLTNLAIKFFIKRQSRHVASLHYPRLAVVPSEHVGLAITAGGLYEPDEIALIMSLVEAARLQDTLMLDIGANIGNHACALGKHFSQVLAFEPNPPVAALLRANVMLNGLENITIHQVGLAEKDAELSFGIAEAGNDGSGSFAEGGNEKTLPVRRGDDYIGKHAADIVSMKQRIGFIKCDVQGFERDVFAGLRKTLAAHQPIIMFESENHADGQASWSVLKECGYTNLARIRAPGDDKGKLAREWSRLRHGTKCWLEPITSIPETHCNLLVSVKALPELY